MTAEFDLRFFHFSSQNVSRFYQLIQLRAPKPQLCVLTLSFCLDIWGCGSPDAKTHLNWIYKMKTKLLLPLSSFVLVVCLAGCCQPEIIGTVPNTLRPQETNNWCWAAVTQMLAEHLGLSITQCALANHRFSKTNCCTEQNPGTPCPKTNDCNTPG